MIEISRLISMLKIQLFTRFPIWLLPGALSASLIIFITIAVFNVLWCNTSSHSWRYLLTDRCLWYIIKFTFMEALLSTILSTLPAIPLAQALYRQYFPGRDLLLRFCNMMLGIPGIVGIFGIISVFGQHGWIAQLCQWLHLTYNFSLYGLHGILLVHVFFNLPLATQLLLLALKNIPIEQRQIAAQLGISTGSFFRLLEWPYLRQQFIPTAALIFILCFSSFATVLTLGGGPRATTIELAVYQALSYDFDVNRATFLALLQMICCLGLVVVIQKLNSALPATNLYHAPWRDKMQAINSRVADSIIILVTLLFLLPPLLAVIINGFNHDLLISLQQPVLWMAVFTSLIISLSASLLCLLLTSMLLWSSRELRLRKRCFSAQLLDLSGMIILAIPNIVLATGFFLLAKNFSETLISPALIIILVNAMMAIPYALKILKYPMQQVAERYQQLCFSLDIVGINRLRLVEWRILHQSVGQTLVFASTLSLGDFGIITLFGSDGFQTLPLYLYQQIGAYRNQDGAVTALVLLILCLLLCILFEKLSRYNDNTK